MGPTGRRRRAEARVGAVAILRNGLGASQGSSPRSGWQEATPMLPLANRLGGTIIHLREFGAGYPVVLIRGAARWLSSQAWMAGEGLPRDKGGFVYC
jgi:hypothetical protein